MSVSRATWWGNSYKVLDRPAWGYPAFTVVHVRRRYPAPDGPAYGGFANKRDAAEFAVELFKRELIASLNREPTSAKYYLGPLVGRDLMCFCKIGEPCHADVLLKLTAEFEQGLPLTGA
jgi:hypothetical protein